MANVTTTPTDLAGRDGIHLRGSVWVPAGPRRGVVVLAHGKDEHIGRYAHVVSALTGAGFAVAGHDHRGHGNSDGLRGQMRRFDDYVDDFGLLVDEARRQVPGVPLFVLGHSMGGLIATRYALGHQRGLAGLILSGPALLVGENVPSIEKRLLLIVGKFLPNRTIPNAEPGVLSRNPDVERQFAADPLCHNELTKLGFARGLYMAAEQTLPRGAEITVPLLIMHGKADQLTSPRGSERFFGEAVSIDKTLKLWPDNRHEIFNDLDQDAVIAFMVEWLLARTTS